MASDQPATPATSDERRVEAWLIAHAIARAEALAPENARKHKATIVDIAIRAAIREARPLIEAEARTVDPARRLVEIPDPGDRDAVDLISRRSGMSSHAVVEVLRALTDQGGQP